MELTCCKLKQSSKMRLDEASKRVWTFEKGNSTSWLGLETRIKLPRTPQKMCVTTYRSLT